MKFSSKNIALVILTLMSVIFVVFFYGNILQSPNNFMFCYSGDALKNYANFKYHIQYDNSFISYNGVFYPYGESIIFTDIHPALASFYKLLGFIFPSIGYYSVGIINLQILLSIIITSIVLFFVFIRLKVSEFTSVFGAFAITVLSSHILLLNYGHWALSYAWSLPLAWLLLIIFLEKNNKLKWSIFIAINTFLWFLTHGYQGLTTLLFTASVFLMLLINNIKEKQKLILFAKHFVIQVIAPVGVYYFFTIIFDNHLERINMPFTTAYTSDINFILTPNYSFLKPLYYFFNDFTVVDKSWSLIGNYIGFSTLVIGFVFLIKYSKYKHILKKDGFNLFIPASFIILAYSFGMPFKYNLEFVLDFIPKIKQFTGLGRFAWVFYFVITVFGFYFIDKIIKQKYLKYSLVFLAAFVMSIEGGAYHAHISKTIDNPNILKQESIPVVYKELTNIDVSKYQAVITLPFFINYGNPYSTDYAAQKSSYLYSVIPSFTGLPTLNATLSRPPLDEERKLMQFFSPNNYYKEIKTDFKSDKPFLILHTKEKLPKREADFLKNCTKLKSTKNYDLYEIDFNKVFDFDSKKVFDDYYRIKNSLILKNSVLISDSSFIYFNNFNKNINDTSLFGNGVYSKYKLNSTPVLRYECTNLEIGKIYNISFWYFNKNYDQAFTVINLKEINLYNNSTVNNVNISPLSSEIIYGNWSYVEIDFEIVDKSNILLLNNISQDEFLDNKIYIDNLLIREKSIDCYQEVGDSILLINNMIYKLP